MKDASSARHQTPVMYALPEKAHLELVEMHEHLGLLVRLAEPGTAASNCNTVLHPHAMSWWFKRLRRDIARVLKAIQSRDAEEAEQATADYLRKNGKALLESARAELGKEK